MMHRFAVILVLAALVAGCAAGRAFGRGEAAARNGDWDSAAEYYRRALQADPERTDYRIALERAMINAANIHLDQARVLDARGLLEDALREYRRASEFDPSNRVVAAKVLEMERRIRDLAEVSRPQPTIQQLRERARQAEPLLNPASRDPIDVVFTNASLRDILNTVGMATGINVSYERDFQDRSYSVQLRGVTLEEALTQILGANTLFYKVVNQRTIMVIPDNPQKRAAYEEQVIRTFFISHADATELVQTLNQVIRIPAIAVQPVLAASKTANTITVRGTSNVVAIIEKMIEANDNPRAEVVIDLQILEVNRTRAKQFGLDLSNFSVSGAFSPETDPRGTGESAGLTPRPFNLNTVTRGVSAADFYLSVPSAVVRFLESDSETKLIAKPQLRGAEGQKIVLNLGDEIPVPSTVFTPVAGGGAAFNPLTSFTYRPIGVNVEMTARVTFENEIILDLLVESSTLGDTVTIGDQGLPSFGARRVTTRIRLRDGESNLLAGLLREDQRRLMRGLPGLLRLPVLRTLFAANDASASQTDIIMLITPRIVRTHELTQADVSPIYIGTQQALGLGGPPPLIAPIEPAQASAPSTPAPGPPVAPAGSVGVPVAPPGSSPIPGTTILPAPAEPPAVPAPVGPPALPAVPVPDGGGLQGLTSPAPPSTAGGGQILLSPPGVDFRVDGGPYTVPVSITGASMLSGVTLTVTFNPSALRVRTLQEGSFMRTGGVAATFTQQVDGQTGRIDIAIVRSADLTGVAGTGLLAAVLFDAVGAGPANLTVTGTGTGPRGAAVPLAFTPVPPVTVR
jgi:type II secretory pathway component GspD/PulD (secretin)